MSEIKGPDGAQTDERMDDRMDEMVFERLVCQYQKTLLRMCYLHLRDKDLAEDAVQETFIKAYRSMQSFRGDSSEKTWLMKIAMNVCCDIHRSHWFKQIDFRYTPDMLPQAVEPFEQEEETLVAQIMQLPLKLREVILLYYYQNMSVMDIADSLGISQSSVSGRLKRAREKLRVLLERRDIRG